MTESTLYPLRFDPVYQYRLWGGRRLADWLPTPLPGDEPIGEAWLLSDCHDYPSRVAEGSLKGRTISELIKLSPEPMLGKRLAHRRRFPPTQLGGSTSIDINRPGIDKTYGVKKLRAILDISIPDMIFIGDVIFPGGNDYPAKETGVLSVAVRDPHETKRVIEAIIVCLGD